MSREKHKQKHGATSNVSWKDVRAALLKAGFQAEAGNGATPKPTAKKAARKTRNRLMAPNAQTSLSGQSGWLTGQHAVTHMPVRVHIQISDANGQNPGRVPPGMLTVLQNKTGLDFSNT